ncbi:MAG: Holliday junction branch migration protein RuvA [Candidatus Peregrinibacteria bacterium]
MISLLRGTIRRGVPGSVVVDTGAVGYSVTVPLGSWDELKEGETQELLIVPFIREDRFDLFGFRDEATRQLFSASINLQGVGPRMGMELCSVPRSLLAKAIDEEDVKILTKIKGIGKKTAEKLIVDLRSLKERQPGLFSAEDGRGTGKAAFDSDAVEALRTLGYESSVIMKTLRNLPHDLATTEERVAAALRSL